MEAAAGEAMAEEEVEAVEAAVAEEDEEAAVEEVEWEFAAIVVFVIDFEQTFASSLASKESEFCESSEFG